MEALQTIGTFTGIGFGYAVLLNALGSSLGKPKSVYVMRITGAAAILGVVITVVQVLI